MIEDKCSACHMPMAHDNANYWGQLSEIYGANGLLDPAHPLHELALDGNSCTLCHQILKQNFGRPDSFSGGYVIDHTLPIGRRPSFGPYDVEDGPAAIMRNASGYTPVYGPHMAESELCITCHQLYTPYFNDEGQIVGEFPEQTLYYEWLYSGYRRTDTCIDCHFPVAQGGVVTSLTGGVPRSPFMMHYLVGGNTYMLRVFDAFRDELGVVATPAQIEETMGRVLDQLQNRTATLALEASASGDVLTASVQIASLAGHKVPSAFPSRRAWLHVTVTDGAGRVIFESGGFDPESGAIDGNDNDADPARYEPHYQTITQPDEVQIYEPIMQSIDREVTTELLRATSYIKDNRLLPKGFDINLAVPEISVRGAAADDPDFAPGGDTVTYEIALDGAKGPFTVSVELLYQSISYRWAMNLIALEDEADEIARFARYYNAIPNTPTRIAGAQVTVE
ncbi:MAG: hypothetical protein M5R40_21320 [Anaerolineae bacterium]|nr:hypothetical protein [Anaerolineae bacterium]